MLCNGNGDINLCLDRACPEMRGDNNLVERKERGLGRGLGLKDIECSAGHLAALDRIIERLLINEYRHGHS